MSDAIRGLFGTTARKYTSIIKADASKAGQGPVEGVRHHHRATVLPQPREPCGAPVTHTLSTSHCVCG